MMPTGLDQPPEHPGFAGRFITLMTRRRTIQRTLTIVLLIALGPLALLAAAQGLARLSRDARSANIQLAEAVTDLVSPDRNRLTRLQPLVEMLALKGERALQDAEICKAVREAAEAGLPSYATLAVADGSGRIGCSSQTGWVGNLLPPEGVTQGEALGLTGRALVIGPKLNSLPADIRVAAVVSLQQLATELEPPQQNKGAITLISDGNGRLLAGPAPEGLPLANLIASAGVPLAAEDGKGMKWVLASALLRSADTPAQSMHLLFARPRIGAFGKDWWFFASSFAVPLMALLLASMAIWIGAHHSILRWVTELRQVTARIGEGNYRLSGERFEDAPTEVRSLVADVQRMARTISERDRTLTEAFEDQKQLTLELNHRVRNNLQLISSYLTLQGRGQGADQDAIAQVRLRVSALALVHRLLYTDFDRTALRADILMQGLADLLRQDIGMEAISVEAPAIPIGLDAAVPLALSMVEAASWLKELKQHERGEAADISALRMEVDSNDARLTIKTGPVAAIATADMPRLLAAFARQLGGELSLFSSDGVPAVLQIRMPAANLDREFHASVGNNFQS